MRTKCDICQPDTVCVTGAAPAALCNMHAEPALSVQAAHRQQGRFRRFRFSLSDYQVTLSWYHLAGGRASAQGEGPGMLQGTDEITRADERTDPPQPSPQQSPAPLPSDLPASPRWPSPARLPVAPSPRDPEMGPRLGGGEARQEIVVAR